MPHVLHSRLTTRLSKGSSLSLLNILWEIEAFFSGASYKLATSPAGICTCLMSRLLRVSHQSDLSPGVKRNRSRQRNEIVWLDLETVIQSEVGWKRKTNIVY